MTSPAGGGQYQQDVGAPGGPHGPKITSVFDFSAEALEQLAFWLEQRGLHIPVTQLLGFSQFTAQEAPTIATSQTTTSLSYTDLSTVGPTLSGLPDGKYLLLYAADLTNSVGSVLSYYSPKLNSTEATDANAAKTVSGSTATVMAFAFVTLSNSGNNTVTMRYKVGSASTLTAGNRRLAALKYSNL